jgi:hypothetical protein
MFPCKKWMARNQSFQYAYEMGANQLHDAVQKLDATIQGC